MAANIHQHFLPAHYLAGFSDGRVPDRLAPLHVWNLENGRSYPSNAGSICAPKDFYSKDRTAEHAFHQDRDDRLAKYIARCKAGNLTADLKWDLFRLAAQFFGGNTQVDNQIGTDLLSATQVHGVVLFEQYMLRLAATNLPSKQARMERIERAIRKDWRHKVFVRRNHPEEPLLWTSDCPFVWLSIPEETAPSVLVFPLTRSHLFVSVRQEAFYLSERETLTSADCLRVRVAAVRSARRVVIGGSAFTESDSKWISEMRMDPHQGKQRVKYLGEGIEVRSIEMKAPVFDFLETRRRVASATD